MWLCVLWPSRAQASPLFELVGAGDVGFTGRASPSPDRSAYFNPALLLDAPQGASLGVVLIVERLEVEVAPRDGVVACESGACDVPEVNGAGPESFRREDGSALERPTLPTAWLEMGRPDGSDVALPARPRQGAPSGSREDAHLSLALSQALLPERLVVGVSALVPLGDFVHGGAFYSDEREQFFSNSLHHELYGDRLQSAGLAFGAAVGLLPGLSLGASLTLGITSGAHAPVYVGNLGDLDTLLLNSDVGVALDLAPHIGLSLKPLPWLRLSATAHSPQGTRIETSFSYVIATGIEQRASQRFELGYLPWTFGLGVEASLAQATQVEWTLAAEGRYALWSDYRDRHAEQPSGAFAWSDVASFALTAGCRVQRVAGFVSSTFAPSPVPDQRGRTSYVDSDRVGVAAGASYDFDLSGVVATVALDAQLHRLLERGTDKRPGDGPDPVLDEVPDDAVGGTPRGPIPGREGLQTNSPGFPAFASSGYLVGAGLRLSLAY